MAGLHAPLSTLRRTPHGMLRMTRGRCSSLHLHRNGLAPSTPYRSPGALHKFPFLEVSPCRCRFVRCSGAAGTERVAAVGEDELNQREGNCSAKRQEGIQVTKGRPHAVARRQDLSVKILPAEREEAVRTAPHVAACGLEGIPLLTALAVGDIRQHLVLGCERASDGV